MDPERDEIEPHWWAPAFAGEGIEEYEPAELLSGRLQRLAEEEGVGDFAKEVLQVLAKATSAMLDPADWLAPFSPAIVLGSRRTVIPADLSAEDVALLARIAPLVNRPDLQSRVADVAWFYGDRSQVELLDLAVDAYRAAPLTADVWFAAGRDGWWRALELANRRGATGRARVEEMTTALIERVLAGTVEDGFLVPSCAALLRENGLVSGEKRREVAECLVSLAAAASAADPRLSRHLEREAAACHAGDDAAAAVAATDRAARTYLAEAQARLLADPEQGALVRGHFIEKAIATFRSLPRSYRLANGIEELVAELRESLYESRETALEHMTRISSGPVDLAAAVSYARARVSGHADRFDALVSFATLAPPLDADAVRTAAETVVRGSVSHIFRSATYAADGRKVAAREGSTRRPDDPAVESEVVGHVTLHAELAAHGLIRPALELLTYQHRFDRGYLAELCADSPTVPEGHAELWGAGLAFGLAGDYGPAVAILVPQLEQVVRILLKRRGVHTLFVDDQTGVESEKSLNALLELEDTAGVFGAGMVMELRALLVVQGGVNLRNEVAHGLLDDASAWGDHALYLWWFCLRLALLPLIQMARGGSEQSPPAGNGSGLAEVRAPETAEEQPARD